MIIQLCDQQLRKIQKFSPDGLLDQTPTADRDSGFRKRRKSDQIEEPFVVYEIDNQIFLIQALLQLGHLFAATF